MKLTAVIHNRRTTSSPSQNPLPAAFDRLHSCSRVYGISWQCVDRSCRGGIVQSSPHNAIAMLNGSLRDPRATLLDKMSTGAASIATQSSFASVQMLVSESFKVGRMRRLYRSRTYSKKPLDLVLMLPYSRVQYTPCVGQSACETRQRKVGRQEALTKKPLAR